MAIQMIGSFLRRWGASPDGLLWETPGEGGGSEWPDYQVPAEVGGGGAPAEPAAPAERPGQPAAPAREPEQPAGGAPAARPGASGNLPPYRVAQIESRDELRSKLDRLEAQVAEQASIKATLAKAFGLDGGTPAMDPRTQRIRDGLFKAMPELKDLVEKLHPKAAELLGLADSAPTWGEQQKVYWQGVARRTQDAVHDGIAKMILGTDKAAKDLDPEMADDVRDGFIRWVERDETGQRVARYEQQDGTLVSEFLKAFGARYVDPVRRTAAVAVGARGAVVNRLPQSGPSGMPAAAAPPVVDNKDVDAVHGRAWAVLQQLRGQ